ncbi:uncharacterized protein LOC131928099 [Physella acuta]|uniref:uncharacterized protein LOC131928099 n=1 Tax=Physella acuta TaxID=109671 RepID=UPI0027DC02D1|nr:uncharacterized protein LOC131928099 [Physella acuta]
MAFSPTQETSVTKLDHGEHPVQSPDLADSNDLFVSTTNPGLEMDGSENKSVIADRTGISNNTTVSSTLHDLEKGGSEDSKMFDTMDNPNHKTSLTSDEDNQSVASISTIPPTPPDLKSHLTSLIHSQKKKRTPSVNAICVDVAVSKQTDQEHLSSEGSVKSCNLLQTTLTKISPCTTNEDKKTNVKLPLTTQIESYLTENTLQGRQCIEQELTKQVISLNSKLLLNNKEFEEVNTSSYSHNKTEKKEIKTTCTKQPEALMDVNEKITLKKTSSDLTNNPLKFV